MNPASQDLVSMVHKIPRSTIFKASESYQTFDTIIGSGKKILTEFCSRRPRQANTVHFAFFQQPLHNFDSPEPANDNDWYGFDMIFDLIHNFLEKCLTFPSIFIWVLVISTGQLDVIKRTGF